MSSRLSSFLVAAGAVLALAGCAKHSGILAPTIKDPAVFDDGFGSNVDFQAFAGSKLDALAIDSTVTYSGATSIRVTVPGPGDPSGTYAGGAFTTSRARDLSIYDALTFWAKADKAITLDVCGLGNDNTGTSKYEAKRTALPLTTTWTRFVIPIPLASRLGNEKGLFFFAEGPEMGQGSTIWFDDVVFENLGTITNPRPSMPTVTLSPDVGSYVPVPGTRATFAVDGADVTVDMMQGYLTFVSSNEAVAVGGEGTVRVTGLGTADVTASLGGVAATGTLTLTPNPSPATAAPTPSVPAGNVISLFSNAYTSVPVDTWSASWDLADVADVQVAGNATKKYTNLTYAGIEFTGAHVIDASSMTAFHLDVWAANGTTFKVKLVDFGANGVYGGGDDKEHELTLNSGTTPAFGTGSWSSLEIPLTSFVNLTTRGHLAQLILSGDVGTVYVDNVYFHN
jgi:hypothetical protein